MYVRHICFSSNTYNNEIDDVEHTSCLIMSTYSALFTSCCGLYDPKLMIKDILEVDKLPDSNKEIEDIVSFDWKIETKYYTAEIKLCSTTKRTVGTSEFAEGVQAVVIYFNAIQVENFDLVKAWLPYLKEISPAIQILVCKNIPQSQAAHRHTVQNWCLDNDFELVELDPEVKPDEDDDFQETTGIKRITQALHAHMWPNMILKENQHTMSPYMRKLMEEESSSKLKTQQKSALEAAAKWDDSLCLKEERTDNGSEKDTERSQTVEKDEKETNWQQKDEASSQTGHTVNGEVEKAVSTSTTKDKVPDETFPDDDVDFMQSMWSEEDGGESFEQLFSKFRLMKEKAESLPQAEKKKYAEKVTIAFWKAIGGDEEEIGDLSDFSDS
ncbi:alpha- and gamma-adaptin-binding protein p34-like [Ostrea edulis]|uniref:alpha- and gamma-adaptin-binding protein p34-like n=1 Tax=Ostrea edulis TaxID=37623 RepID=UPI0024AFA38C|nr:alpha- and gamma-adaptin-binding protein p34-like [Ostrea edulis]